MNPRLNHQLKKHRRNCRTKAVFRDKNRASRRAKELTEETKTKWRYYECEFGRHYHLTSY